jgi:predicted PurR-regulated permease PerM
MNEPESQAPQAPLSRVSSGPGSMFQRVATLVVDIGLVLLSFWVLRTFLGALAWSVVLALATWPLYQRFQLLFAPKRRRDAAPALFTVLIALVFIVPLGVAVVEIWREMTSVVHWMGHAERNGVSTPAFLSRIPMVGAQIESWWVSNLAAPGAIGDLIGRADTGVFARITQEVGFAVARRLTLFVFTILSLFFLFRDGVTLGKRFQTFCHRLLGPSGEYLGDLTVCAIRGTADGMVLVGLGEGAILGIAYQLLGVPHPALLAAVTGVLAIIPFGAPVIYGAAALLLIAEGSTAHGIALGLFGTAVIYIADYLVRPAMIGGAAKLPFIWVLLGIFSGLQTFGLVGLFLGPAIMAILVSLWREWTDPVPGRSIRSVDWRPSDLDKG